MSGWRELAACRAHPQAWWWFSSDATALALALRVCQACPVGGQCLAEALAEEAGAVWRFGLRAGLTAGERSALDRPARRLRLAVSGEEAASATGGPGRARAAL